MTSTGRPGPAPADRTVLPALPVLVLALLLVVSCGGWSPVAAPGPRTAEPQARVLASAHDPYETAPSQDAEPTAAPGRASARHQGRRGGTPRRTAPCAAEHAGLPLVPAALESPATADGRAGARRHLPHGPGGALPQALAPSALQVFRC
ncbi:hypothetical protein [Streptomyces showdoensis]|uniref:Lipoprotein n=1 Tax=Streptomyces showdoensis TaxID=68268 RepID=A0A2P2GJG7_STREW|nr:hypothetical protein [Streptomyces showdoensis]KKZ71650.1 hypothetical protein VO63_22680 [Streptomyces showdoensis]